MAKSIRIGRGQNNDVFINDPAVSLNHCEISQDDNGEFRITDLNSTNGTYVNGTLLLNPNTLLRENDIVRIGNTALPWKNYFVFPTPSQQTYQQPYPQPPVPPIFQQPQPQTPRGRRKNGMGTAGFVLSLISLALCWLPVVNVILFLLGLAFSIVGVSLRNRKKGLAIAGLAISVVVLICLFFVGIAINNGHLGMNDFEDIFDY
ncbi:MAG: FHA domain-containing protein [Bacteroidales bacterium]|nr:FHA domain-containing protein [Bacteroidales bacterium]